MRVPKGAPERGCGSHGDVTGGYNETPDRYASSFLAPPAPRLAPVHRPTRLAAAHARTQACVFLDPFFYKSVPRHHVGILRERDTTRRLKK